MCYSYSLNIFVLQWRIFYNYKVCSIAGHSRKVLSSHKNLEINWGLVFMYFSFIYGLFI